LTKKSAVYCQTPSEKCQPADVLLGHTWAGMKLRCGICGRFTVAGEPNPLTAQSSTSRPWRNTGIDY